MREQADDYGVDLLVVDTGVSKGMLRACGY